VFKPETVRVMLNLGHVSIQESFKRVIEGTYDLMRA